MVKKLLVTRPRHDLITSYLYDFSKEIVEEVRSNKDIHITNLESSKAIRVNLERVLIREAPSLVFLNGHGDTKIVTGHNDEIILDEKNIRLTKDKIVYALSCNSLEELGPLTVKAGAKAYIGYKSKFMIVIDPSRSTAPNKDKNALPFKKVCSILIDSLVFGNTASASIKKTKEEYARLIKSYGTSEDDPFGDVSLIRFALTWDHEFLDMCGDPNALFEE